MADKITRIKGFADLFSPESDAFTFLENTAREVFGAHGYTELRLPVLERTELFARSIGDETDVVQKEMYTFTDRGERSLTLRPEATAGVMRAYIEGARHTLEPVSKYFTYGPMFRYERPQKGRMRQFHQINCECLGAEEPHADAEVIIMLMQFLTRLGLKDLSVSLNSLGCKECRPAYHTALRAFLERLDAEQLCGDCQRRMVNNPLRVLDCKVPGCQALLDGAPQVIDYNCEACRAHIGVVERLLTASGVNYALNPRLVRGLDYYNRTTFEVLSGNIGAQSAVTGGGRYDGLVRDLGGPDVPGVGFACGMERLAMLLPARETSRPDFYLAPLAAEALDQALTLAETLRAAGLSGQVAFAAKSLKSQMRQAGKLNARKCVMIGQDELAAQAALIKDMDSGEQETVPLAELITALRRRLPAGQKD